jgi:D-alanyl-D-alanine carboxypeptidase
MAETPRRPAASAASEQEVAKVGERKRSANGVRAAILTVAVLAAIGVSGATSAASALTRHQRIVVRLDSVLGEVNALRIPGYVVGVTGGQVGRFQRAVGFANVATKQPMTPGTHFRIGSITKTFTATVILKLVQSGKLHLNDPISIWEPRVPNAKRVTIKMLLNMTSGIWDEGGDGPDGQPSTLSAFLLEWCNARPTPRYCQHYFSPQKIVDLAIQDSKNITHGPAYPPGVWYYSDTNYVILGIIAQRVTHKSFGDLLRQLVLDPLHLTQTSLPTRSLSLPSPSAAPYRISVNSADQVTGYVPQLEPSPSSLFTAGAVVSTLHDLQIWARALATGELLTPAMQRLRLQLVQTGLAFAPLVGTAPTIALPVQYGLGIGDAGGMFGHNGEVPGYTTEMWYLPAVHGTVVAFFNSITPCAAPPGLPGLLSDATFASLAYAAFGGSLQLSGLAVPETCDRPQSAAILPSAQPPLR